MIDNAVTRFIFRNANRIAGVGFPAGHICVILNSYISGTHGLATKSGTEFILEAATAAIWIGAGVAMGLARQNPVFAFRLSGFLGALGAFVLSASGVDYETLQVHDWTRVISPLLTFLPANIIMAFQNEIAAAHNWKLSRNFIGMVVSTVCRYPVLICGLMGMAGVVGVTISALNSGDAGLASITLIWVTAHIGLIASDPRLQNDWMSDRKNKLGKV